MRILLWRDSLFKIETMADNKDNNPKQGQQINIELDEKIAEGIYSNLAIINHSISEYD